MVINEGGEEEYKEERIGEEKEFKYTVGQYN